MTEDLSKPDILTGCDLLRGLVYWDKPNRELQARLETQSKTAMDVQALALELTGMTVPEPIARVVFDTLTAHVQVLCDALKRPVGIRTAALDLLDHLEADLRDQGIVQEATHESLVRMAYLDHLTGLPNFRRLSERFKDEIKRATRYRRLLSLIMLDLDGFKEINDRFGHLAGNAALKHVAVALRAFMRETDVVGRYGGDEFMVLLPETARHTAEGLARAIQTLISTTPLPWPGNGPLPLTISSGMASFPRDAQTAESLMAEADGALYHAKRAGRNQVCFSRPKTSTLLSMGTFGGRACRSVHVIGDFNGWDRMAEPMIWDPCKRCYSIELFLAPGKYEYKLLLDQETITVDPGNPESVYDGFDGRNSVLRIVAAGSSLLGSRE
jgi:diguanylate cyclase (GGDEF)-like protein